MVDNNERTCVGCGLCYVVCPRKCIHMVYNNRGFLIPTVNEEECINCKKCLKICPVSSDINKKLFPLECNAIVNKDMDVRRNSSSGGAFSILAEYVIERNGCVFGAAMTADGMRVEHIEVKSIEEIGKLSGSKYVQSYISEKIYNRIIEELRSGKLVLFSGTPCQNAALVRLCSESKVDYKNLISVDFICHGVCSTLFWKKYLIYILKKMMHNNFLVLPDIVDVKFCDKRKGWRQRGMSIEIQKWKYYKPSYRDMFYSFFSHEYLLRETCFECKFRGSRVSDFTLADFWGCEHICPGLDDNKGTSLFMRNSTKACEIWEEIKHKCDWEIINTKMALSYNKSYYYDVEKPENYYDFWEDINLPLDDLYDKYINDMISIKQKLVFILSDVGLLERVKKWRKK